MEITEKEFAVIREISNNHLPDQRTIATRVGISLGLTNLIIKRLIKQGYIKAKQLNQKKIQYLLTPKGFSEKTRKSYYYTTKTIGLIKSIRERLQGLILEQCSHGVSDFEISGDNEELAVIIDMVFKNLSDRGVRCVRMADSRNDTGGRMMLLSFVSARDGKKRTIDIVQYLSETGMFYQ